MGKRILSWIVIIGIAMGSLYIFESNRLPCRTVLSYSIGQFDSQFGLTEDEFRAALLAAEAPWESALGREVFQYDADAAFPVNLIFDERQQRTLESQKLDTEWDRVQTTQSTLIDQYDVRVTQLATKRRQYDAALADYEDRLARYNAQVAAWNRSDRTDEDELAALRKEARRLEQDGQSLESLRAQVNALVAEVNRYAKEEEKVIERYNTRVEDFTETYGESGAFDQGIYAGESIDIYQFDDSDHLNLVLVHEFGHALGLEHVASPASVMYPMMGEQDVKQITLSTEDRAALADWCSVTAWQRMAQDLRAAWELLPI